MSTAYAETPGRIVMRPGAHRDDNERQGVPPVSAFHSTARGRHRLTDQTSAHMVAISSSGAWRVVQPSPAQRRALAMRRRLPHWLVVALRGLGAAVAGMVLVWITAVEWAVMLPARMARGLVAATVRTERATAIDGDDACGGCDSPRCPDCGVDW